MNLYLVFFQIPWDKRRNERKKQGNADQEKQLRAAKKLKLGSEIFSKNENKDTSINIPHSIQLFYLQSRYNCLESKKLS